MVYILNKIHYTMWAKYSTSPIKIGRDTLQGMCYQGVIW